MKLYLDEAGHTGKHLFDENQPLFVYAGVWLDDAGHEAVLESMALARRQRRWPTGERKGSKLVGTSSGRQYIRDCLTPCFEGDAPVSVFFFNKPFQAAAVVVEDCTDYVYNPAFDERWTWDTRLKEPLAQKILTAASPAQLMAVWKTRHGSREDFIACYRSLLFGLQLNVDRTLSEIAHKMMRADFGAIWHATQSANATRWAYSPNLNSFVSMIQGANRQARARAIPAVEVVHDEQVEYGPSLTNSFELFRNAQSGSVQLPNGNVFEPRLDRLQKLSFAASSTSVGLQLADFVASSARVIATVPNLQPGALCHIARWLLRGGDEIFPYIFGPPDWRAEIFQRLVRAAA